MNAIPRMASSVVLASAALLLPTTGRAADAGNLLAWHRRPDSFALLSGGQPVWQFNWATNHTKPFFHPVALPGNPSLTWQSPPDHPWHYGLWFSWKYINRVNYWEQDKQGQSQGTTEWRQVSATPLPDQSARLDLDLAYRPSPSAEPVLTEHRTIAISAPASNGSYTMDWVMVFTAGRENLRLDRTPQGRQGTNVVPGGYAGLSARLARGLTNIQLAATADPGASQSHRYGYAATASDFNGQLSGTDMGLAILDHPANPRSPTRWYVITDPAIPFWYINAAWLQLEPSDLPAHQSFTLRYRVVVHPGRWDAARLQEEEQRYGLSAKRP